MTTRVTSDAFIDLMCADPDLLEAEFDAIVAAEFPDRRRPADRRGGGTDHPGSPTTTPPLPPTADVRSRHRPAGAVTTRSRERSPPGRPA